jgi:hypothetical protein
LEELEIYLVSGGNHEAGRATLLDRTHTTIKHFMGYIIDITLVMDQLFLTTEETTQTLTKDRMA